MYTPGTMGGAGFPALPNQNGVSPAPTWPQDIDNGLVTYQQSNGVLHAIEWQTFMVGGQYYLPPSGRVWIAANFGYATSGNIASYDLTSTQIVTTYTFWDAVAYVNVTGPVNLAGEFAQITDTYAGTRARQAGKEQPFHAEWVLHVLLRKIVEARIARPAAGSAARDPMGDGGGGAEGQAERPRGGERERPVDRQIEPGRYPASDNCALAVTATERPLPQDALPTFCYRKRDKSIELAINVYPA